MAPSTSAFPETIAERKPVGADVPIIGIGMIAIGISQPAVASHASVCSASIASGETGQNSTLNGWSRRTASRLPKIATSSSRSQCASASVAISSWTCLLNSVKVLRQCATAGPGPPPSMPELTIRQ